MHERAQTHLPARLDPSMPQIILNSTETGMVLLCNGLVWLMYALSTSGLTFSRRGHSFTANDESMSQLIFEIGLFAGIFSIPILIIIWLSKRHFLRTSESIEGDIDLILNQGTMTVIEFSYRYMGESHDRQIRVWSPRAKGVEEGPAEVLVNPRRPSEADLRCLWT